jgi:hypothetical protein
MTAVGALILFVTLALVITGTRRAALMGMMAGVLFLTQGQHVTIAGFNLFAMRFLEMAGLYRVISRNEFGRAQFNKLDKTFIVFYSFTSLIFLLRTSQEISYQLGAAIDAFCCYFTFRGLLGDIADFQWFLQAFVLLLIPYVALLGLESFGHHNVFTSMGGIECGSWSRNGRPRCQGSFRDPSILGTLGAAFLPLYIALFCAKIYRARAVLGIGCCLAIVLFSNSGGPVNTAMVAIVGWLCWKARRDMQKLRRFIVIMLVLLAIFMKAPVWYLPAKVSTLTGGDGWHRSYLIDQAVHNMAKWWFDGMSIKETSGWFPYELAANGGADITNEFVAVALNGGFAALALFIVLLVRAFKRLGVAMAELRAVNQAHPYEEFVLWGLGVTLACHIINWMGITYFDQFSAVWFLQFAAISNITDGLFQPTSVQENTEQPNTIPALA